MEYRQNLINWLNATSNKAIPECFDDFRICPQLFRQDDSCRGTCQCEKSHLKYIYVIEYIPTGDKYDIGSSCINQFYDYIDKVHSESAKLNLQNMVKFVSMNETYIRNKQGKGICVACSKPTIGNKTQKASTNYYHYCKDCILPNKKRRCVTCLKFWYYIDQPLYKRECPDCYYGSQNMA